MNYLESHLFDMFWENHLFDYYPYKNNHKDGLDKTKRPRLGQIIAHREFVLPSGKRCDLFISNKTMREFLIVEFKIEANIDAIIQLKGYFDEVCELVGRRTDIFAGSMALAAQYFHPHTLYFAEQMKIECIHLTPVHSKLLHVNPLNDIDFEKGIFVNKTYHIPRPLELPRELKAII